MKTRASAGLILLSLTTAFAGPPGAAAVLPVPPEILSLRGLPLAKHEAIERANSDAAFTWLKQLTAEQRAAWFASIGRSDPGLSHRIGEQSLPTRDSLYNWRAAAHWAGLKAGDVAQLERDKLLIEDVVFEQSFSPYTKARGPVFITSDSLLNGFHVLFEDSFRELEARRAFELRRHLEDLLTEVRKVMAGPGNVFPGEDLLPGWRQAQRVVGPALRLLGTNRKFFDPELRDEIDHQVEEIRRAELQALPDWLGPPSRTLLAIDYRRFRPVGFYTQTESLQNYFRATRWLQSIPFRADRDAELTAIGLLGNAMSQCEREAWQFFEYYHVFLGRPDDRALEEASMELQNFLSASRGAKKWSDELVRKRLSLLNREKEIGDGDYRKLSDSLRLPPEATDNLAEIQYRIVSAYRLPDSLVLAKTAKPGQLPSGLAVATMLGSDFARRHLPAMDAADLEAALKAARKDWQPGDEEEHRQDPSLYDSYLGVLAALCAPAEPDAPKFMSGEPWAAKSCFTLLGSWAQMRHTFTLQAKEDIYYFGLIDVPPGFVEPNPEFFHRLADLAEEAAAQLDHAQVFQPSPQLEAENLRNTAAYLESLKFHLPGAARSDRTRLSGEAEETYVKTMVSLHAPAPANKTDAEFQKYHRDLLAQVEERIKGLADGTVQPEVDSSSDRVRWNELKMMARRLEALAHKQLRRQSWTKAEEQFIRTYGERLALVLGYFGNSWLTPNDDAPRWSTVASDPTTDTLLAVAVGRPRLLHVLYPWQGQEIHCTGAVMSYYEYVGKQRLSDEAWKKKIDSLDSPNLPGWISPILVK